MTEDNIGKAAVALAEKPVEYELANGDQIKLNLNMVKAHLVSGKPELVTDSEFLFFMAECKARRLNPWLRHCYLIKYSANEKAQIIESIHHKRNKAMASELCQGWEKGLICFKEDGTEVRTRGIVPPGTTLAGAWFKATPKGWEVPYEHEINLDGFIKYKNNGQITKFWKEKNQPGQIMKVVEAQGLAALFDETAHTYLQEELDADTVDMAQDQTGTYAGLPDGVEDKEEEPKPLDTSAFDELVKAMPEHDPDELAKYLFLSAKALDKTVDEIKLLFADDFEDSWANYEKWALERKAPPPEEKDEKTETKKEPGPADGEPPPIEKEKGPDPKSINNWWDDQKNWINKRANVPMYLLLAGLGHKVIPKVGGLTGGSEKGLLAVIKDFPDAVGSLRAALPATKAAFMKKISSKHSRELFDAILAFGTEAPEPEDEALEEICDDMESDIEETLAVRLDNVKDDIYHAAMVQLGRKEPPGDDEEKEEFLRVCGEIEQINKMEHGIDGG